MLLIYITIFSILILFSWTSNCSYFINYNRINSYKNDDSIEFSNKVLDIFNLNNYSELNFNCIQNKKLLPDQINFHPPFPMTIDYDFQVNFSLFYEKKSLLTLRFQNIKLFDTNNSLFKSFDKLIFFKLEFYYSDLKVLNNGQDSCVLKSSNSTFKKIKYLCFALSMVYFKKTCPLFLSNLKISFLNFNGLSNSLLKRNILEFIQISNSSHLYGIESLQLNFYNYKITKRLIDSHMFNKTEIWLYGIFDFMDFDDDFPKLIPKSLNIKTEKFLSLFKDGGRWLSLIDSNIEIAIYLTEYYKFPEEDFCFFKNIPINNSHLLNPPISSLNINCTCTILHVLANFIKINISKKYRLSIYTQNKLKTIGCFDPVFYKSCNLQEKLNKWVVSYDEYSVIPETKISDVELNFLIMKVKQTRVNCALNKIRSNLEKNYREVNETFFDFFRLTDDEEDDDGQKEMPDF
ncbi:unnamed protein product [Brachionus calyciflorus]|uniref:Uncharacterized protein n=1 Tax=Brachionus calyciflorus TaxID=104777 RepID=A0A813NG22_9BILA|nr:unnamed protein product [Brachionus calyciflorus]